jgi:NADH-quinone oxidoreductase subunit K
MQIGLLLIASILLFCTGLFILLTRRHAVMALIGIELMLNAANLNFAAFQQLWPHNSTGQAAAVIGIVLAAAGAAVGLALIYNVWRNWGHIDLHQLREKP